MAANARSRRARGFTLIELMMVVAIIGLLASVAIPSFVRFQIRSKTAERTLVFARLKAALDDKLVREGRIAGATGWTMGMYQPPFPPTTSKRVANWKDAGWRDLDMDVEGNCYYSYFFMASEWAGGGQVWAWAVGDLDGDMRYSWKQKWWNLGNTGLALQGEWPLQGQEDDASWDRTF